MSSTLSTSELLLRGAPVELRDGSHVRVRQGRRSDRALLERGFERLSAESRYRRFLTPMPELSDTVARRLTELDHHDLEAIVALDEATGEGVGVARYARDPARPNVAEVAVTVLDEWQGVGLGTLLLELISARARVEGIGTFTALMLATNDEMLDLIRSVGEPRVVDRDAGTVQIEIEIPELGVPPELAKLLRIARLREPGSRAQHRGRSRA
jgi:GNAT superfamily N-acetyltransferase